MNNLNEGILDFKKLEATSSPIRKTPFKIKKIDKSILPQEKIDIINTQISNEIVIPQTIEETIFNDVVSNIEIKQQKSLSELKIEALSKKAKIRENSVNVGIVQKIQNLQQIAHQQISTQQSNQQYQEIPVVDVNTELIETYEQLTNEVLPEDIDLVELVKEIEEISEVTPGMENLSINDFDFEITTQEGWKKHTPSLKSDVGQDELNSITKIVWKNTDNLVKSRKVDLRGIGNINKKLVSIKSDYRLYPINYSFGAPKNSPYGANKGVTIVVSIPTDFNNSKRLLIYIAESRSKFIIEVNCDIEFIAKVISDYYIVGFETTKALLRSNLVANPLSVVVNKLALSRKFLIKPLYDGDDTYTRILVETKVGKHQWLRLYIYESAPKGTYKISFASKVDSSWSQALATGTRLIDIPLMLTDKFVDRLNEYFTTEDWSKHGVSEDDADNRELYLFGKLTYKELKSAFNQISEVTQESPETGIFIKEVLSQLDTKKDINAKYGAEIIIGKSNFLDYYILTYSAEVVIGGDKRHGKDYITTDKYYEDNLIHEKSRVPYQERYKTVLAKQGIDRNYNSREYIFTLQYSINSKVKTIQSKNFEEIKNLSGFLTSNPK